MKFSGDGSKFGNEGQYPWAFNKEESPILSFFFFLQYYKGYFSDFTDNVEKEWGTFKPYSVSYSQLFAELGFENCF